MSIETEQAVLGGLLDGADVPRLEAYHFADTVHQELFAELKRRAEADIPRCAVSMNAWWKAKPYAAELDDPHPYLADLQYNAPAHESVQAYADQVKAAHDRRELAQIGKTMAAQCEADEDPKTVLEDAERQLAGLADTGVTTRRVVSLSMAVREALQNPEVGHKTGWADLDRKFNGWLPEELYYAAGRPGMGKSLFGGACALSMARRGIPSAFVSLEMGAGQAGLRFASMLSGVPYRTIKRREMTADQERKLGDVMDLVDRLPLTIMDIPGASVAAVRNMLRRLDRDMKRRSDRGLGFVCLDYLGYLAQPHAGHMSLNEKTTANSGALKQMARELKLPVLVLAQLNRAVEQRGDKHPMLSDLRDSGSIEQDADVVFGLYRDAYYAEAEEPDCHESDPAYLKWQERVTSRDLDVDILKNRDGETGRVVLYCDPATGEIRDYDHRSVA